MSFSLRNFKIHSPAIFDQCWWSPTRIILMYSIIIRQTFRLQLLLLLLLPSWIDKWEPGCLKEESQVILNLNLPRNSGKKTLQMWKRNDQLGRATRHWSKHECMATPQHFGRLHGKQVKWWQSGKSSWEASLFFCDHLHFIARTRGYWQWVSSFDPPPQHAWGVLLYQKRILFHLELQ